MIKKISFFLLLSGISCSLMASNFWQDDTRATNARDTASAYRTLTADHLLLKDALWQAPLLGSGHAGVLIELPLANDSFVEFEVFEAPIMAPNIASKYPDFKTFKAFATDGSGASGRLDYSRKGFHAFIRHPDGPVIIDPENKHSSDQRSNAYRSIERKEMKPDGNFRCLSGKHSRGFAEWLPERQTASRSTVSKDFGDTLRTYRLALSATNEYRLAVSSGDVDDTLLEMSTGINRVNEILESDVNLSLQLISGTELISTSSSDFSDDNAEAIIMENQTAIDNEIGFDNYDIGHIFATQSSGLAELASVCDLDAYKAQGVSGIANPTGDPFWVDYVAHEIGHQLGATHTFNADGSSAGACQGNRQTLTNSNGGSLLAASAYEPGSGSTIMAYAGICASQNLQNNSDPYFHARTIEQIRDFVDGNLEDAFSWEPNGSRCGVTSATSDAIPDADAGSNYTIPASTPFVLTGSATDADSDESTFTYTWEQFDLGDPTTSLTAMHTDQGEGPLIRSRFGSNDPERYIPTLETILSGDLDTLLGERLPTTDRDLNFMLTVRSGTHGVSQDLMTITVDKDSGPFDVTAPTNFISFNGYQAVNVTWDVADTDTAPVNCSNVDIDLSTDEGETFATSLAANTNNDGSQIITLPNISTTTARVRVLCRDNIFFDINEGNLTINKGPDAETTVSILASSAVKNEGNSGATSFSFSVTRGGDTTGTSAVDYAVSGTGESGVSADDFDGGVFPSGTLNFAPNETNKSLTFKILGDRSSEGDENFTVTLSSPVDATIIQATAQGTILDDDTIIYYKKSSSGGGNSSLFLLLILLLPLGRIIKKG